MPLLTSPELHQLGRIVQNGRQERNPANRVS